MKNINRLYFSAVVFSALTLFNLRPAPAQTVFVGNNLGNPAIQAGAPDGGAPLVILGEYNPGDPLSNSAVTLPSGTVQDVKFYGQTYSFTLYALAYVGPGPHTNEQTFQVVASAGFSGSNAAPGTNTLAVTNFTVQAGDLLAFAGSGPYYPQQANDAVNSDAAYQDPFNPNSSTATPPGGAGTEFTVGTYIDTNATYGYITDVFDNQGRTYGIGVDVSPTSSSNLYLPVYQVTQAGATFSQAMQLARSLNIPTNSVVWSNGTVAFIDPSNFMAVPYIAMTNISDPVISNLVSKTANPYPANPITLRAFDFATLSNLTVFDTNTAINLLSNALATAGLTPQFGTPHSGHTHLFAVMTNADATVTSVNQELDTLVNYQFSIPVGTNNYPVIGAGAHVQADFGSAGNVTRLFYAIPQLISGPAVQIISPLEASNRVASLLPPGAQMNMQLVYLAVPAVPPPGWPAPCTNCGSSWMVTNILPYYAYCGTMTETDPTSGSNYTLITETHMIPATDDTNYIPSLNLSASALGTQISASVAVTGGTPPYMYQWSGPPTGLSSNYGASVTYTPITRVGQPSLAIAASGSNASVQVMWPYSPGFALESSTNLSIGNWQQVSNMVQTTNAMALVTIPATVHQLFLRLRLASQTLPMNEAVGITVTDANGISVHANQTLQAQAVPVPISASAPKDPPSYATESPYVGTPWDDAGFSSDTGGWENNMGIFATEIFYHISAYSLPGDFMEPELAGQANWIIPSNVPANATDGEVQPLWPCADVPNQGVNSANLLYYFGHGGGASISFTWPGGNFNTTINNFNGFVLGGLSSTGGYPFVDTSEFEVCNELNLPCYKYYANMLDGWGSFPAPWQTTESYSPAATNLLWMVFDACDVLVFNSDSVNGFPVIDNNPMHNPVWNTLGPDFNGLHMLLGFNTSAVGGVGTAGAFANSLNTTELPLLPSWFAAVSQTQPSTIPQNSQDIPVGGPIVPAAMGPIGPQGIADFWDPYFQGIGGLSIGPSIPNPNGWWYAWVAL